MSTAGLYSRWETSLESALEYENPVQDARVTIDFENGGVHASAEAFWDGGRTWRVRFSPEAAGRWRWRTRCSDSNDGGLHGRSGEFECEPSAPRAGGPLCVSPDKRHFTRAGGTPFFWLGDTVWNGPLKSAEGDWALFLADRARKGFNVIQFVAAQWISAAGDAEARPAYLGHNRIRIEPAFFRRMDRRIDAINATGMIAAPVLAWAAAWNPDSVHLNPGNTLSDEQLVIFVRYLVSRYGAHQAVWILAGDGIYTGAEAERWRRVGRLALAGTSRLGTMHPGGKLWVAPEYRSEPWFRFNGYQSGHWNDDDNLRWINEGPPSQDWRTEPRCPHVNLEPCYEAHRSMATGRVIDAHDVRRACYWSLLAAPPAGVTYGAHGIWSWESTAELPMSHPGTGVAPPWFEAMHLPGSDSMAHLKAIFGSIDWWRLNPCPELLEAQPGHERPAHFISAARADERDLAMIYLPEGGEARLMLDRVRAGLAADCYDPASGAMLWRRSCSAVMDTGGPRDRILILHP